MAEIKQEVKNLNSKNKKVFHVLLDALYNFNDWPHTRSKYYYKPYRHLKLRKRALAARNGKTKANGSKKH
ncbi:hypothetical protein COOONC_17467 [Cooperia oncophora]